MMRKGKGGEVPDANNDEEEMRKGPGKHPSPASWNTDTPSASEPTNASSGEPRMQDPAPPCQIQPDTCKPCPSLSKMTTPFF